MEAEAREMSRLAAKAADMSRKHIISAFEALAGKQVDRPRKKHGNIPL